MEGKKMRDRLHCRFATPDDICTVARLNAQLIEDEGHRNTMTPDELTERMRRWLEGEYQAVLFEDGEGVVGYALFKQEPDWVYLRPFFIRRERRRQGLGRAAMKWLIANFWVGRQRLRIDVLVGNAIGIQFWKSLGFVEYCLTMERPL